MKKTLTILFLALLNLSFGQSTKRVEGRILSEDLESFPGVQIFANDSLVGQTDSDGFYNVTIGSDTKMLTYEFVGCATTPVLLTSDCPYIELILRPGGGCYLGCSRRKIHRIEKRRFKNLGKYHAEAFRKGLFKTEKTCGEIQFEAL